MRRFALLFVAVLIVVGMLPQLSAAQSTNRVRVMHASPDAPAVDVFVNGSAVLTDVPFFAYSDYLTLPDGTYQIAVAPAGQGTDFSVIVGDLTVEGGVAATLAAVDELDQIEAVLYDDDLSPVPAGLARVRIIHASPDAPPVDIKVAGTNNVVVAGAPFKGSAYVEVPAGTYAFDISPAGSADVVFTTPELRFEPGWIYTLVATGFLGENFWVQSRVDQVAQ